MSRPQNRDQSLQSLLRSIVYLPFTFHTQLGNSRNHQRSQQPKPQTRFESKQAKHPANISQLHSAERARRAGDSHCGPSGLSRNTLGAYPALTGLVRPRKQADAEAGRRRPTEGPLPKTQRGPQGEPPPRASLGADRKAPSASATPCPPAASRCSTLGEGGLNCRVRDGTG